jgi:hypothetical protein
MATPLKALIPLPIRRELGGRWNRWNAARRKSRLLRELAGSAVACNVCRWEGARFADDIWHSGTICPNCHSQVRHRMLAALFDGALPGGAGREADVLAGRGVLHFAPERQLRERIRLVARRHVTADFDRGDCDLRLDISAMSSVSDESFDTLIACDVLEHVPDDAAAFREIFRVLRPGGTAILTVPQSDPPAITDEDSSVTSEADRERRFGQKDHVRMYGDDFADRVAVAGFTVETVLCESFPAGAIQRHVLHPPAPNPNPLATNQRRLYLARKP